MRYELRKILGNPSLCLLLSAVVIINALMFFCSVYGCFRRIYNEANAN